MEKVNGQSSKVPISCGVLVTIPCKEVLVGLHSLATAKILFLAISKYEKGLNSKEITVGFLEIYLEGAILPDRDRELANLIVSSL